MKMRIRKCLWRSGNVTAASKKLKRRYQTVKTQTRTTREVSWYVQEAGGDVVDEFVVIVVIVGVVIVVVVIVVIVGGDVVDFHLATSLSSFFEDEVESVGKASTAAAKAALRKMLDPSRLKLARSLYTFPAPCFVCSKQVVSAA